MPLGHRRLALLPNRRKDHARLDDRDSLAIVHFGSDVKSLPSMKVTDENRERMRRFIARMIDDGGTNIGAGLKVGEQQLQQAGCEGCIKRLVLMSDGQPTEGISSLSGLSRIVSQMHERGISVTALGVGYDFNEDLMTQLASVGVDPMALDSEHPREVAGVDVSRAGMSVRRADQLRHAPCDLGLDPVERQQPACRDEDDDRQHQPGQDQRRPDADDGCG